MVMRRRVRPAALAVLGVVAATLVVETAPSVASPYRESFVTMISQRGDHIGQGVRRYFHDGNARIGAGRAGSSIFANVYGEEEFRFEFAVPAGQTPAVGEYDNAVHPPGVPGGPGIAVYGDGRACNDNTGRFTIKDLVLRGDEVARLWIVFQHTCRNGVPMIGEFRYRMPGDGGHLMVGPRALRWPRLPIGGIAAVAPIRAVNTSQSPVTVASASLEGPSDMEVRNDECTGRTLQSNQSCAVWVRFAPSAAGRKEAVVRITEAGGAVHEARLEGEVVNEQVTPPVPGRPGASVGGGPSLFSYDSDPGEYVGQGEQVSYDESSADIFVDVDSGHHFVLGMVFTDSGENWLLEFSPSPGDILAPGLHFPEARRAAFTLGTAGLDVGGAGRGCNTLTGSFTVHALRVDDFGDVVEFAASFVQRCDGHEEAMRGTFRYRGEGPARTPPPFPVPSASPSSSPPPSASASPSPTPSSSASDSPSPTPPPSASPSPVASPSATPPSATPSPTPAPEGRTHDRDVTLSVVGRRAGGTIEMDDPVAACRKGVLVRIRRKIDARFRTVATATTDDTGRYEARLRKRKGTFRAVVRKETLANGDVCARDVSPKRRRTK